MATDDNTALDRAVARAVKHGFSIRKALGGNEQFPFQLVSSPLTLKGLSEVLSLIDGRSSPRRLHVGDREPGLYNESNGELIHRSLQRLNLVSRTLRDMEGTDDGYRKDRAEICMEALEGASERIAVLHNEMDCIRETGEGREGAEADPAEAIRKGCDNIRDLADRQPDPAVRAAARNLADGLEAEADDPKPALVAEPVDALGPVEDIAANLESLLDVLRLKIADLTGQDIRTGSLYVIERDLQQMLADLGALAHSLAHAGKTG